MFSADDVVDCSWLSVTREDEETYLVGNGVSFLEVPAIAVEVIEATCGRCLGDVRKYVLVKAGVDVDVVDFVNTLDESGVLDRQAVKSNIWDLIRPESVKWIFSWWLAMPYFALIVAAIISLAVRPSSLPSYNDLLWGGNTFVALIFFFVITWVLVFIHEFCHVVAARSLNVRARLSLGTRMQFLVAQTDVSGVWEVEKSKRYRVYLSGIVVDVAMAAVLVCLVSWVWPNGEAARIIEAILIIKLSQIAWQFLVFTRTDVYYAVANMVGSRNLLADTDRYLRWRVSRRGRVERTGASDDFSKTVRRYAYVLVLGRIAALVFFVAYTIPVTVTFGGGAVNKLSMWPSGRSVDGIVTLAMLTFGWALFMVTFVRRYVVRRRVVVGSRTA